MSIHRFVLHNDQILESSTGFLMAGQVGLLSGWGIFSTIRVSEGVLFAFERHWQRLMRDARLINIQVPWDESFVRQNLVALTEANHAPNCTLRVVIVRNGGSPWEGTSPVGASDLIAMTSDTKNWGSGVKLGVQPNARYSASEFSGAKVLSWAMNLTWLERAQNAGFDEVILLNERGEISECTSANIFITQDSRVFTPPLSSGCLPGITREVLLGEVHHVGFEVSEKVLVPEDLERADEVFITSTTRELLPVLSVEGRPMRNSGVARPQLQAAFSRYFDEYIAIGNR